MSAHHATRVAFVVAAAAIVFACATPTDSGSSRQAVWLRLAALPSSANAPLTGPYVSVLDSLNLVVTSVATGERQEFGKHLERRDSVASFPIRIEQGDVQFVARALSNNRTLLFAASSMVKISAGSFAPITVDMSASGPVLLVAPDSSTMASTPTGSRSTVLTVHDRGRDSLVWRIKDPLSSMDQCPRIGCVRFLPDNGVVQAGKPVTFQVIEQLPFSKPITFVVTSSMGEVPVVVRPF